MRVAHLVLVLPSLAGCVCVVKQMEDVSGWFAFLFENALLLCMRVATLF